MSLVVNRLISEAPNEARRKLDKLGSIDFSNVIQLHSLISTSVQRGDSHFVALLLNELGLEKSKKAINLQIDGIIPPLLASCQDKNVNLVQLLLDFGADPNEKIHGSEATILTFVCLFKFREDPVRCSEIVKLLLDHDASLGVPSKFSDGLGLPFSSDYLPIHSCAEICKWNPLLANRIVKFTPPRCFSLPAVVSFRTPFSQDALGSPLSLAFQRLLIVSEAFEVYSTAPDLEFNPIDSPVRMEQRERAEQSCKTLLKFVLLPLLRAGAAIVPDPFASLSEQASQQIDLADAFLSSENGSVLNLLIAARQKSSIDLSKILGDVLKSRLQLAFPMNLQQICRISLLSSLPMGVEARQKAIDKLALPQMLTDFLNFTEFDSFFQN